MRNLPDEHFLAIELLEADGAHRAKLADVLAWPGLSGAQRAAALVLVCVQHVESTGSTPPSRMAEILAISPDRAGKLFDGVEHPPFELLSTDRTAYEWTPSQRLEYGE